MNHTECIRDIFTDLLTTDLSDFDEKTDKYGGSSLSQLIQFLLSNKEVLITHCEIQKERFIAILANHLIILTNNDKKILKDFNIFKLYCAKCNSLKRKDGENKILYCCNNCKLVRYCCRECQTNDWVHHKLICKRLTKAISNTEEIKLNSIIIKQGIKKLTSFCNKNNKATGEFGTIIKILKDCHKEKNIKGKVTSFHIEKSEMIEVLTKNLRNFRKEKDSDYK